MEKYLNILRKHLHILIAIALFGSVGITYANTLIFKDGGKIAYADSGKVSLDATQWSGMGINYGHQFNTSNYSTTTVDADLARLQASGITKIRVVMSSWISTVTYPQQIALRAKQAGFHVLYGVCACVGSTINSTQWSSFLAAAPAFADWAAANGIDEYALGNEEELHVDNSTITITQARSDLKTLAATIKASHPSMTLEYVFAASTANRTAWSGLGLGSIDKIGANEYYGTDPVTGGFQSDITAMVSTFGSAAFVGEWNTSSGYNDFNDETAWAENLRKRMQIIRQSGISDAYFFTYGDGQSGVPADSYAVKISTGWRYKVAAVLGINL